MHETIIAVSKGTNDKLGFMVSKSNTAPVFNAIKDKNTFYTRDLVADTALNVYLSVTDKTPATATGFTAVDGKLTNPEQFLEKNTEYTLYVYQLPSGEVVKTEKFTTIDYPTDAEITSLPNDKAYFYAIPKTVHSIGMKVSEKFMLSWLVKGLVSGVEFGLSNSPRVIACDLENCVAGIAITISFFLQQKQNDGATGKAQFQEALIYNEINTIQFGTWNIKDAIDGFNYDLFTFTEIE